MEEERGRRTQRRYPKSIPLFAILPGLFKCSATIQPRPMPLDIDNGLPAIHMQFGTSDTNEATFFTHVDSCAVMNIVNLKLHQWIITTNPDIVEIQIKFDDKNPFDPIRLNCALDEENENLRGTVTSLVTYVTRYNNSDEKPILLSFSLRKDVAVNAIIGKPTLKSRY